MAGGRALEQWKETLLIGTVYIALPTADVYSDGAFIVKLALGTKHHPDCNFEELRWNTVWNDWSREWSTNETCLANIPDEEVLIERHPAWTSMMILPFLASYIMTWCLWYQIDHRKQITWLACLLNLYPQARAAGVILELWRNPRSGLAKKKKFEREVTEMEVFMEAVPTTFVMTYIIGRLIAKDNPKVRKALRGEVGSSSHILFLTTYLTSIFSASMGMAKVLKVGPCKVLKEGGLLSGFLTMRFILIFLACLFTLFGKSMFLLTYLSEKSPTNFIFFSILDFIVVSLPGLITAFCFTWHQGSFKTFLNHPSFLLLPTFTYFSFRSNSKKYCNPTDVILKTETELCFSLRATFANILFSSLSVMIYSFMRPSTFTFPVRSLRDIPGALTLASSSIGILFTAFFLSTTYSSSFNSSCSFCSPPLEFGVYRPLLPRKAFVSVHNHPYAKRQVKEVEEDKNDFQVDVIFKNGTPGTHGDLFGITGSFRKLDVD